MSIEQHMRIVLYLYSFISVNVKQFKDDKRVLSIGFGYL